MQLLSFFHLDAEHPFTWVELIDEMFHREIEVSWMLFVEDFPQEHVPDPPKKVYPKESFRRRSRRLLEKRTCALKKDKAVGALVTCDGEIPVSSV